MALSEELGSRPDLVVVGARLVIDANAGSSTIAVRSLTLRNAEVVTNGTTVTIEALEVISDDGSVVSYRDATLVSATGAGTSGGRVTLVIAGSLRGNLKVQLPGQGGKDGANGNAGGKAPLVRRATTRPVVSSTVSAAPATEGQVNPAVKAKMELQAPMEATAAIS